MAVLSKDPLPRDGMLSGVRLEYGADGKSVTVRWKWPANSQFRYCFIFCVSEEEDMRGISLEELLDSVKQHRMRIISKKEFFDTREELSDRGQRFYLYPATEDFSTKEKIVYEQAEDNKSELFQKRKQILVTVKRGQSVQKGRGLKGLFGGGVKEDNFAAVQVDGDIPEGGGYLTYHCENSRGERGPAFGLDLESFYRRPVKVSLLPGENLVIDPPGENMAGKYEVNIRYI